MLEQLSFLILEFWLIRRSQQKFHLWSFDLVAQKPNCFIPEKRPQVKICILLVFQENFCFEKWIFMRFKLWMLFSGKISWIIRQDKNYFFLNVLCVFSAQSLRKLVFHSTESSFQQTFLVLWGSDILQVRKKNEEKIFISDTEIDFPSWPPTIKSFLRSSWKAETNHKIETLMFSFKQEDFAQ